jgi:predicted nucleotide-binding protein
VSTELPKVWSRLNITIQAAAAAIAVEPKHLAPVKPKVERALVLLNGRPSAESRDELTYLVTQVGEFVDRWKPIGRTKGYHMPDFAKNVSREMEEAQKLLVQLENLPVPFVLRSPIDDKESSTDAAQTARPSMFVGSSAEGLSIAEAIQLNLDHSVECTLWSQGVFGLSNGSLESLVTATKKFDFAVLVLTPDDLIRKRGTDGNSPRDNVIFELGLFMGALGRERTFIVHCRSEKLELPSDLAGITPATYAKREDGNLIAALGSVCTQLKQAIQKLSKRKTE